mgnify:CR=1 FL=1
MIKTFFYIELVGALALIRVFVARGPSRWAALSALVVAVIGIASKYVPALAEIGDTKVGQFAAALVKQGIVQQGSGLALPIFVSLLFALSWHLKGRRWWGLDVIHGIAALCFLALWTYTQL